MHCTGSVHACPPSDHSNSRLMLSNSVAQHLESMAIANGTISPGVSGSHGGRGPAVNAAYPGPTGPGGCGVYGVECVSLPSFSKKRIDSRWLSSRPVRCVPASQRSCIGVEAFHRLFIGQKCCCSSESSVICKRRLSHGSAAASRRSIAVKSAKISVSAKKVDTH
eukprot:scaffold86871_cov21-Tisochrysis_lutea.AAC.1